MTERRTRFGSSRRRAALVFFSVLVLLVAAVALKFAVHRFGARHTPSGQSPLVALDPEELGRLRDAFNAGRDEVRVLALLSPT